MFLPTTRAEMDDLGWDRLQVILVTGDSYIDAPSVGIAVIGHVLLDAGYRVGILGQPDIATGDDISRLGEPELFWGVTGGSVDSLVANTTASGKRRRQDDYTPGGANDRRPDRAVIAYANLIRRHFRPTAPIVLGGIEASLRRVPHYDFWTDKIRRSILFDAKADALVYGMGERAVLELAAKLAAGKPFADTHGLSYVASTPPEDYVELPPFEEVAADPAAFEQMFHLFYRNNDPLTARGLRQRHGDRWLVQNPPAQHLTQAELDAVYALPYEREQHPCYAVRGPVRALETIRFSITTHRGCYGECNFCAIAAHEGRTVVWRSEDSVVGEAERITRHPTFRGIISDVGGPTANMYGYECRKKLDHGACPDRRCLSPGLCRQMRPDHGPQLRMLQRIRALPRVKKAFVASGIRYDLVLADAEHGDEYLQEIVLHHVSGQMKVAPEHTDAEVLRLMGKPGMEGLLAFRARFNALSRAAGKPQFLTYYFIAAHPGCSEAEMAALRRFATEELHIAPEQVQVFTPTPSTYSTLMYYTGRDPFTGERLFVEKNPARKERQKAMLTPAPTTEGQKTTAGERPRRRSSTDRPGAQRKTSGTDSR